MRNNNNNSNNNNILSKLLAYVTACLYLFSVVYAFWHFV